MEPVLIIFTLLAILIALLIFKQSKINRQLKHFTSPPGLPLLRHLFLFTSDAKLLPNLLENTIKYGGLLKMDLVYGLPFTVVSDPEFLKYLLGTTAILNKTENYDFLNRWLGTGLLTSKRKKWEKTRKILTPAFHLQVLETYVDVFHSVSDVLIQKLKQEVGKDSIDVYPYVTLCTLDIICETAMGTKLDAQDDNYSEYVKSVREMCRIIVHRSEMPLKWYDLLYFFSRDYWKEKRALKILHNLTNSVIYSRKCELSALKASADDENKPTKKKLSFLDLLLESSIDGRQMTDEEIRQEVDTFMFAGHDTTSTGIGFTLYCLSVNPNAQQKAAAEQERIFGDDKSRLGTLKDFQNMKYLEMVIKESLRLYPPVPIYGRSAEEDTPYYDGGVMPKKMSVSVFAYGLHRNPLYYPEPEKFDPERFGPGETQQPYTYIPFSVGPRSCIGQKFALLEMKAVISKILRNFEVLPDTGFSPQVFAFTVLRSSNGIRVKLKLRD